MSKPETTAVGDRGCCGGSGMAAGAGSTRDTPEMSRTFVAFKVDDMTCGHCASTIADAVRKVDASALIEVDQVAREVRIQSSRLRAPELEAAIREAGFTPAPR